MLAIVTFLLFGSGVLQPGTSSSPAFDLPVFRQRLDEIAIAVEQTRREDRVRLFVDLPSRVRVRTADQEIDVSLEHIAQRLEASASSAEGWESGRKEVLEHLRMMQAELAGNAGARSPDPTVRIGLETILSRREFRARQNIRVPGWSERIRDWLRELLRPVAGSRVSSRGVAAALAYFAAFAALVAILVWLVRQHVRERRVTSFRADPDRSRPIRAHDWALRAMTALRAGDTREAAKCAYQAAVRRLAEQGLWRVDETRTPREYVQLFNSSDTRTQRFTDVVRNFERAWYGHQTLSTDDARRLGDSLEQLGCLNAQERAI